VSERTDTIGYKDKYGAVIQLIVGTEAMAWNRFYNYLVVASVLLLAWFTIYSQATPGEFQDAREGQVIQLQRPRGAPLIMTVMSALGAFGGFAWACLGWRGRVFMGRYVELGRRIEDAVEADKPGQDIRPCHEREQLRDTVGFSLIGSFYLLVVIPGLIGLLFLLLLWFSWK
jgi:hypothetical protein